MLLDSKPMFLGISVTLLSLSFFVSESRASQYYSLCFLFKLRMLCC